MRTTPLYNKIVSTNKVIAAKLNIECKQHKKFVILQGGGDSAKTVSAIQFLCTACLIESGIKVLIAADTMPNLKDGALYTYERFVEPVFKIYIKSFHITDKVVTFRNGSQIKFKSFEHEKNARGAVWDYSFFNEANLFHYDLFWQIQRKTRRQVLLDFNPTAPFWAHGVIMAGMEKQYQGKWIRFIVDHRHNPFLTKDEHDSYENISDPEKFRVYARGLTGKVNELVLGKWIKGTEFPKDCERITFAVDYGYTNDPTALVMMGVRGKERHFKELSYTPGLSIDRIIELLEENGYNGTQLFFSEHDKDHMLELGRKRIRVFLAKKAILSGLAKFNEFDCYYYGSNFEIEVMNYKYKMAKDLIGGKEILTNEPVDAYNHLADASRYACYSDFLYMCGRYNATE